MGVHGWTPPGERGTWRSPHPHPQGESGRGHGLQSGRSGPTSHSPAPAPTPPQLRVPRAQAAQQLPVRECWLLLNPSTPTSVALARKHVARQESEVPCEVGQACSPFPGRRHSADTSPSFGTRGGRSAFAPEKTLKGIHTTQ